LQVTPYECLQVMRVSRGGQCLQAARSRIHKPPNFPPSHLLNIRPLALQHIAASPRPFFCIRRPESSTEAIPYVPISIELLHSVRGSLFPRFATSRRRTVAELVPPPSLVVRGETEPAHLTNAAHDTFTKMAAEFVDISVLMDGFAK
jgi:hypothetical protein